MPIALLLMLLQQLDETRIVQQAGSLITAAVKADQRLKCRICSKNVAGVDRQNHVGKHILHHILGHDDPTASANKVSSSSKLVSVHDQCNNLGFIGLPMWFLWRYINGWQMCH